MRRPLLPPTHPLLVGLLLAVASSSLAACTREVGPRLCDAGCAATDACMVGRCRPLAELPANPEARRYLVLPADLAALSAGGPASFDARVAGASHAAPLPSTIALGRAASGTTELLLRFVAPWRPDAEVLSAYLVLEPAEGAALPSAAVAVETARILSPWDSATVSWGRQPSLDLPQRAGSVRPRGALPVRVDVTGLVRDWAKRLADDHGFALIVAGKDPTGATFATGVAGGAGPRLEAYVK